MKDDHVFAQPPDLRCVSVKISGAVQGVGFRPFVYRLSQRYHLLGWVKNTPSGVEIEVQGQAQPLQSFLSALRSEVPSPARIFSFEYQWLPARSFRDFQILESCGGQASVVVLPDLATCPDCLADIFDPSNRRYLYPFTNCTHCGPRYSIVTALPYDRQHTSMNVFEMCEDCRREYADPENRRFHAQPNACPVCGPRVECWSASGERLAVGHQAMEMTAESLAQGKIAAVKGLGGFHLMADPYSASCVQTLRQRKRRSRKPFAVMFPDVDSVHREVELSSMALEALSSAGAPIVLLPKISSGRIREDVAPGNPDLGVMLAYTPLHHILLRLLGHPVIATSGNVTDEPICVDNQEALHRLNGIADIFLLHNRGIVRQADDSVMRIVAGHPLFLRRARGYAPAFFRCPSMSGGMTAVGAHQKNTIAVSFAGGIALSQHIGDLGAPESRDAFVKTIHQLQALYEYPLTMVVHDAHPDYASTAWAQQAHVQTVAVQHHHAHAAACCLEHGLSGDVTAVVWDGTGLGSDGTIWGGEFLKGNVKEFRRVGHLRRFPLPGGESASREAWRSGLGILHEHFSGDISKIASCEMLLGMPTEKLDVLRRMLDQRINTPMTSSAGRLFDAVAAILGICQTMEDEAEAAMMLEFAARNNHGAQIYPYVIIPGSQDHFVVDWGPLMETLLDCQRRGVSVQEMAAGFHNTLAEMIVDTARRIGLPRVILTGGCFQNPYLSERSIVRLRQEGFEAFWHKEIPPNDGGVALGQMAVAAARMERLCV